jgi:hypothetical protein
MTVRRGAVIAATLALTLSALAAAPAPAGAAPEQPAFRSQVSLVLFTDNPDISYDADDDRYWTVLSKDDAWAAAQAAAAWWSEETGVDWQFTEPRYIGVTLPPKSCLTVGDVWDAFGTTYADYTSSGDTRSMIAFRDLTGCQAVGGSRETGGGAASLERGIVVTVPATGYGASTATDIIIDEMAATFALAQPRAFRTEAAGLDAPTWDLANEAAVTEKESSDNGDPWMYVQNLFPVQRNHLGILEKYELGLIGDTVEAVVVEEAGYDEVIDLVQVPAAGEGNQGVVIRHDGVVLTTYTPYAGKTDTALGVEYRSEAGSAPAGVYITLNIPGESPNGYQWQWPYLIQPIGGGVDQWVPLGAGETFATADGRVHVTVESVTDDQAQVHVVVDEAGDAPGPLDAFLETLRQILAKITAFIKSLLALFR